MATGIQAWSTTALSNGSADSTINWLESQLPSTVNNSARAMMAVLAKEYKDNNGTLTTSGSSNAYTITTNNANAALYTGLTLEVSASFANTGAATINVDTLGVKSIKTGDGAALVGGEIPLNHKAILQYDGTNFVLLNPHRILSEGYLFGLTLSNNGSDATNDIDIAAGRARSSANSADLVLASAITKRLDASWAVGTGNGGLDTGTIGNKTYHVYLIKRLDTGVVDAIFSASASSPTLPSNYTVYRRIGSIVRSGGAILAFTQVGMDFTWASPQSSLSTTTLSTADVTATMVVPTGIAVRVKVAGSMTNASSSFALIRGNGTSSAAASATNFTVINPVGAPTLATLYWEGNTDTSGQVTVRASASSTTLNLLVIGWRDYL